MPAQSGQILSYSARLGTQREYETVMILRSQASKSEIMDLVKRLRKILESRGGSLLKIDSWGMRILSYPIGTATKGVYLYWQFVGGSDLVAEFERNIRNRDLVMRYFTTKIGEDVDPGARPSEVTDDLLETISEPGPDPEDIRRQAEEARAKARAAVAAEAAARKADAGEEPDFEDSDEEEE